jgi:hypothetical protein
MTSEVHAPSRPCASGARLTGDDVQHLVALYWCLKTTIPASDVVAVRVEADDAGNLDDVVVDMRDGRRLYHQVKAAVSARDPANVAWLCAVGARGGPSLLQRLHASWVDLGRPPADIALITSRPLDPNDLLLRGLDRLNHVGNHLRRAKGKLAELRRDLASHLQCDQPEVCRFFDALAIHAGQTEAEWRRKVDDVAMGAGLRTDHAAQAAVLADVREWVKTTRDPRDGAAVTATIDHLRLRAEPPRAVVVINGIDHEPPADDAVVVLDWVARFRGDRPETRRGLVNPSDWNGALADDLAALRDRLRAQDLHRVLVRASLRLPGWFAVSAALRDVAGFDVAMHYRGELWRGDAAGAPRPDVRVLIDESTGSGPSVPWSSPSRATAPPTCALPSAPCPPSAGC